MARSSDTTRCDVASDHTDIQFLPSRGRSSRSVCRRSPALRPNGREHAPSSRRRWNTSDHFLLCRKRLTDDCERPSRAFEAISMTFFSPRPLSMRPAPTLPGTPSRLDLFSGHRGTRPGRGPTARRQRGPCGPCSSSRCRSVPVCVR